MAWHDTVAEAPCEGYAPHKNLLMWGGEHGVDK